MTHRVAQLVSMHTESPLVIAHRGSSAEFPENTFAAFDAALAEGADGIELDVQLSKDEHPVVFHDANLAKAGRATARVSDLSWDELRRLDVSAWRGDRFAGLQMPRLSEVCQRYAKRTRLLVELKIDEHAKATGLHEVLVRRVLTMIESSLDSAYLLCFDLETLAYSHKLAPHVRCVLNVRHSTEPPQFRARQYDFLHAYSHEIDALSAAFAERTHDVGKPLMTWVCNTKSQVEKAARLGAELIMTDKPRWLRETLERKGPTNEA